mmetsp:Transcript_21515/g.36897  ORF Transcript_21515/g.36897 Transcript_21515/m.36897 type:complete len:153 (+) Transcript_21515:69-527(+)
MAFSTLFPSASRYLDECSVSSSSSVSRKCVLKSGFSRKALSRRCTGHVQIPAKVSFVCAKKQDEDADPDYKRLFAKPPHSLFPDQKWYDLCEREDEALKKAYIWRPDTNRPLPGFTTGAEMLNGRVAMLAFILAFAFEFATGKGILAYFGLL